MGLGKKLGKVAKKVAGSGAFGLAGILGSKLLGGGGDGGPGLLDLSGYQSAYDTAAGGVPGEMADVESFYTPEMQQAVLAAMEQQIREQGSQNQASISGAAITSGFGVRGTSREAARRAKADSDMLNEIVNSHIQNAQNIESMRQRQAQEYAANKYSAENTIANQKQQQELAKLGRSEGVAAQQQGFKNQAYADRMGLLGGGLGALGQAGGTYLGGLGGPQPGTTVTPVQPGFADTRNAQWYWPS